jgi:hypothetical protein
MLTMTPDIKDKLAVYHEGLNYYIARKVYSVYDAYDILKEIGLNPHNLAIKNTISKREYTGQVNHVSSGNYDFILSGTENRKLKVNIASYNTITQWLQIFVNDTKIGRLHGLEVKEWLRLAY